MMKRRALLLKKADHGAWQQSGSSLFGLNSMPRQIE